MQRDDLAMPGVTGWPSILDSFILPDDKLL